MKHEVQGDLVVVRILSDPGWVEHRRIGPELLDNAHARARNNRCQEYHAPRRPAFGNQWQVHAARGVCATDNIIWVQTRAVESIHDGVGVPGQALVGLVHLKCRSKHGMTPPLQFMGQQPPTIGTLSAAMNQTVRGHGFICCARSRIGRSVSSVYIFWL